MPFDWFDIAYHRYAQDRTAHHKSFDKLMINTLRASRRQVNPSTSSGQVKKPRTYLTHSRVNPSTALMTGEEEK